MAVCPAGHSSQTSDYCDICGAVIGGAALGSGSGGPASGSEQSAGSAAQAVASGEPCPGCGAAQAGRFCEECGYDFELAALLPAGEQVAAPVASPVGADPAATMAGEPDFDLDAALEAAQAAAEGGTSGAQAGSAQTTGGPQSESGPEEAEAESTVIVLGTGTQLDMIAVVTADAEYYQAQVDRGDIIASDFPFPKFPGERRIALDVGQVRIGRSSASRGLAVEIDLTGPPLDPAISHLHAQLLRQPDHTWTLVDLNSANGTRLNGAEDPIPAETEVPVSYGDRIHLGVWTTITLIEP